MKNVDEHSALLPDERYSFDGRIVVLRSNSAEVLEYVRSVYARFHVEDAAETPRSIEDRPEAPLVVSVTDQIERSGELTVADRFHHFNLHCKDVQSFDDDYYDSRRTVPDPLVLIQWMILDSVSRLAEDRHFIHAGSVAWEDQAIILPAPSGRGKTTLSLRLASEGFRFLSDEVACLHTDEPVVEPFLRRVNLSDHSRQLLGLPRWPEEKVRIRGDGEEEWVVDIADVVSSPRPAPATLRFIIFLRGFAETARLQPLSRTHALFEFFQFRLSPAEHLASTVFHFSSVLEDVRCFRLVMGDLGETAQLVRRLVQEPYPAASEPTP